MISDLGIGLLVVFVFLLLKRFLDPSALGKLRGPGRKSWFTGNLEEIFAKDGWNFTRYLEKEYGTLVKLYGLMSREFLYTSEPEILTQILVKEQDTFDETDEFVQLNQLLFGTGLLSTLGDHHRKQRRLIVPAFSTRRLREMTPIMYSITHKASSTIQAIVKRTGVSGPSEVNLLEWLGRIAAGVICETGLGHTFDTFEENQNNPYADAVKELSPSVIELAWARPLIPMLVKLGPSDLRKAIVKIIPLQSVQKLYRIVEMMHSTSTRIFEDKKKDLSNNETTLDNAKDIMSILLKQNLEVDSGERLSDTELLGQMSTLTFAATDTTSNTLARIFSLLSTHTAEQEALRREILVNAPDGDLDYEKLLSLPYLDAICRETLRMFPPIPYVGRITRKEAVIPLSRPVTTETGAQLHEVHVPKGTNILVGIEGVNRNPLFWGEDASVWKPSRWLDAASPHSTKTPIPGVYSNLMTFSAGGRACIGFKFAELEIKVVLATLLKQFKFSPAKKEVRWELGVVTTPVSAESGSPALPLSVELL